MNNNYINSTVLNSHSKRKKKDLWDGETKNKILIFENKDIVFQIKAIEYCPI